MSKTVSAMDVRQNFGQFLNEVSLLGETLIIERSGKPIARLVPMNYSEKIQLDFRDIGKLPSEIWNNTDAEEFLDELRNEN
jgi:prevent-host-death family protein